MPADRILLTVFTPTYNRCAELARLHASLCKQIDMRFEWLVVDDGSNDSTRDAVQQWQISSPFSIRYLWQENSGKHVAHNLGAQEARGHLFMCVDSDDWLEADAVETILSDAVALDTEEGLLYPKLFVEQKALDTWFPEDVRSIELSDMRIRYGLVVETAIVFKTAVLRRRPFPVIPGENYIPEGSAYYDFRDPELFRVFNHPFYRCEYLDAGLTKNIWKNWLHNPKGTVIALKKRYKAALRCRGWQALKNRVAAIAGIESLNIARKANPFESLDGAILLGVLVLPLSVVLSRKRFSRLRHE